jgi:DegV family protein with EDD domain
MVKQFDLEVVSLSYEIDGKTFEDTIDKNREKNLDEFYSLIKNGKMTKTSQITPEKIRRAFSPYLESGVDILYLAFSSGLSGSFNSGKIVEKELLEKFPERKIIVIDTLCASLGEGLLVYEAVKRKEKGMELVELAEWVEANKIKVCHLVLADDLKHLCAGGRISAISAFFGGILSIKPIIHVDENGKLVLLGKKRGRENVLKFFIEKMQKNGINLKEQTIFISYTRCKNEAISFGEKIKETLGVKDIFVNEIGTVIGSHTGFGIIAVFFFSSER